MFTGIITNLGKLSKKEANKLTVKSHSSFLSKLKIGMSICLNGICLTVVSSKSKEFEVDIMPETSSRTNIKYLLAGDFVNLELPVTPSSFLSGHILQGHIDGIGEIKQIKLDGGSRILTLNVSQKLARYIVEKGSIAVNGISLTVIKLRSHLGQGRTLTIGIIPYTWEYTMLKQAKVGDKLNIETDIIGKYVYKYVS